MRGCVVVLASLTLLAFEGVAAPVTLSTADNPFTPGVLNQGFWSDTRAEAQGNDNYFTGYLEEAVVPNTARGYFSFDLSSLSGSVDAATLQIRLGGSESPDSVETLGLFDVSTDANTLSTRGVVDLGIYDDLGSGASYGTLDITVGQSRDTILQIPLSPAALADVNASLGSFFSVGATLLTLGQTQVNEFVFGNSIGRPNQLVLNVVPEPQTSTLLLLGLLAAAARTRGSSIRR